jgi:hypothetical protein
LRASSAKAPSPSNSSSKLPDDLASGKEEQRREGIQAKKEAKTINEPKQTVKNTGQLSDSMRPVQKTKSTNTKTKNMHYPVEYEDSGWVRNFTALLSKQATPTLILLNSAG